MGAVSFPSFGGITDGAKRAAKSLGHKDVLYGLVAGIGGAAALRYGLNKYKAKLAKDGKPAPSRHFDKLAPLAGGILGAGLLAATKKGGSTGGTTAVGVGLGLAGWAYASEWEAEKVAKMTAADKANYTPALSDAMSYDYNGYGSSIYVNDPNPNLSYGGVYVNERNPTLDGYADNPALQDVYNAAVDDEDVDAAGAVMAAFGQ